MGATTEGGYVMAYLAQRIRRKMAQKEQIWSFQDLHFFVTRKRVSKDNMPSEDFHSDVYILFIHFDI